jgi:hypothetical protein
MLFIYFNIISTFPIEMRENYIKNTCDFEILRFQNYQVKCYDYGIYNHFCNKLNIQEYTVTKEKGLNNNILYRISPHTLYFNNYKIADLYYNFRCEKNDIEPELVLTIVPINDMDPLKILFLLSILLITCLFICNCNINNSDLLNGYIIGRYTYNPRGYYCE